MSFDGKFDVEIREPYATILMRAQQSAIVSCPEFLFCGLPSFRFALLSVSTPALIDIQVRYCPQISNHRSGLSCILSSSSGSPVTPV